MARKSSDISKMILTPNLNDPETLKEFFAGAIAGIAFLMLVGWTFGFFS